MPSSVTSSADRLKRLGGVITRLIDVPKERFADPVVYWRARALRSVLLLAGVFLALSVPLVLLTSEHKDIFRRLLVTVGIAVPVIIMYLVAATGSRGMKVIGWLIVPSFVVGQFFGAATGHGLLDPSICGFMSAVVVAGLLLGARGAVIASGLSICALVYLRHLTLAQWSRGLPPNFDRSAIDLLAFSAVNTTILLAVLIVLWENVHKRLQTAAVDHARGQLEAQARAEALDELGRAKSTFFNNISHEFRTPLTLALGGIVELLEDPNGLTSQQRDRLQMVQRNDQRLLRLVNMLLDFAQIESRRTEPRPLPVDLGSLTRALASEFDTAMLRAGLTYQVDCPPLPEAITVDPELWERIVLNLLSNAFKFTEHGTITVTLRGDKEHAELVVRDTGCGISAEVQSHLFERFFRATTPGYARTREGSGIGLALVKDLCALIGASVTVDSTVGVGSTFTVRLLRRAASADDRPAAPAIPSSAGQTDAQQALRWLEEAKQRDATPPPAAAGHSEGRVLVVEDNADLRDYLRRLLSQRWTVRTAADGEAALEAVRQELPDLVLSDVMMHGMGGLDLVRALRSATRTRQLPVVLLSARATEESEIEGLGVGADDYVVKPFSPRELLARVAAHLAVDRLRREHSAEKDVLMRVVSHEVRGALTVLQGYTQVAQAQLERRGAFEATLLAKMHRPLKRIETLASDLVDLARIEGDQLMLRSESCDLVMLCRQVAEEQHAAASREVTLSLPAETVMIDADAVRITQVLTNLTSNAIKYSPAEAPVALSLTIDAERGEAVVQVRDRGDGIASDHLSQVFERFYRVPGDKTQVLPGMGLGLYICRELIERHRGRIWAESQLGQGSTFCFALPFKA